MMLQMAGASRYTIPACFYNNNKIFIIINFFLFFNKCCGKLLSKLLISEGLVLWNVDQHFF